MDETEARGGRTVISIVGWQYVINRDAMTPQLCPTYTLPVAIQVEQSNIRITISVVTLRIGSIA